MNVTKRAMRECRRNLSGRIEYRYEPEQSGMAAWLDVSRRGAGLRLGRYLRPGRWLRLHFASPLDPGETVELDARVVWCRKIAGRTDFIAGVEVRREDPESALAFAALGHPARYAANNTRMNEVEAVTWSHLAVGEDTVGNAAPAGIPQAV